MKLAVVAILPASRNLRSGASKLKQEWRSRAKLAMLEMNAFVFKKKKQGGNVVKVMHSLGMPWLSSNLLFCSVCSDHQND